ncbi:MAG: hypothetical protein R2794_00610 [Chitinophagales bacterium]
MQIKKQLLIACAVLLSAVSAHTQITQDVSLSVGYAGLLQNGDDDLTIQTGPVGVLYTLQYAVQFGRVGILMTPFIEYHIGKKEEDMLQYFADNGIDASTFLQGAALDDGILLGARVALWNMDGNARPQIYLHLQSGPASCTVNKGYVQYTLGGDTYAVHAEEAMALGLASNIGLDAHILGKGHVQFGISAGVQHIQANVPVATSTTVLGGETTNSTEIFIWRQTEIYGLAMLIIPIQ